jgi:cytochrome c peroxidase
VPDAGFPTYGLVTTQYAGGTVQKYNDLPASFIANLDTQLPLDGRSAHSTPPMSEQDIADLICFLRTLTDADQQAAAPVAAGACTD